MKRLDYDTYVLSTGKEVSANCGIIGIKKDEGTRPILFEGYDGGIYEEHLTNEEKLELAEYMINIWKEYKESTKQ